MYKIMRNLCIVYLCIVYTLLGYMHPKDIFGYSHYLVLKCKKILMSIVYVPTYMVYMHAGYDFYVPQSVL